MQISGGRSRNIPPQTYRSLAATPPFEALLNIVSNGRVTEGGDLHTVILPAVTALREMLIVADPVDLLNAGRDFMSTCANVRAEILDMDDMGAESPERVIRNLKEEFVLTLSATLTGHSQILNLVSKWEAESQKNARRGTGTRKDYYDFKTFTLVSGNGPGRVHMEQFRAAVDAGIATLIPGEGIVESDYVPPLQGALYGQWFTYIHSLWDDSYRSRLARSFGSAPDGAAWLAGDVRSQFFSDINNVRNDFVHSGGRSRRACKNKLLKSFAKGESIVFTVEDMMHLVDLFPDEELAQPPSERAGLATRTNLAWTASRELADQFKAVVTTRGINGEEAVDQAIEVWLASRNDAGATAENK